MSTERFRVGDAERDAVVSALHEHFAQGRLTWEELDERLSATLAARTVGDLRAITRDLPADPGAVAAALSPVPAPRTRAYDPSGPRGRGPWGPGLPGRGSWPGPPWRTRGVRPAWGRHPWRPHPDPPFGAFLLTLVLVAALTGGWMIFPLLAAVWCATVFLGVRHARRWHRRG